MGTDPVKTANLLVELLVEELPPKALKKLGAEFAANLNASLTNQWLIYPPATISPNASEPDPRPYDSFASPRRLAILIRGVRANAPEMLHPIKLMPLSVGLDANGDATPALVKRLAVLGADANAEAKLRRESDGKVEFLFFDREARGATLAEGLQKALEAALAALPIPKTMTYQLADGWTTVNFVRPAHGLIALHGENVVPVSVLGLNAGNETQGHRFESRADPIVLKNADSYAAQLEKEGAVIANFAKRRDDIERKLKEAAAKAGKNLKPIDDEALLDEVTALVERPNVLIGQFEEAFLEVPQECLILTMKANQKYFPLLDAAGKLTNKFLIISNISPADASAVIQGNERVVRPRLADAKFFFDQDRKKPLESRVEALERVVYHNKLGSQGARLVRVAKIAAAIALKLRPADDDFVANVAEAARLAKADLLTDMVGEFPELQGIMGRYYALHDGLSDDIPFAIEDHYKPRFAGDELPRSDVGICVALADKLETLVGMFGIGNMPTGEKDPFALRRHALGVARLIVDRELPLTVRDLVRIAYQTFDTESLTSLKEIQPFLEIFFQERLVRYLESAGYEQRFIAAALSVQGMPHWTAIRGRLAALKAFATLPESESLAAANKRVGNILKKAEGSVPIEIEPALFKEPAETALHAALKQIQAKADSAFESGDYTASLQALAALRAPVDAFFDNVMVNSDDPALKANRLALLNQLHHTMNRVADLSMLAA